MVSLRGGGLLLLLTSLEVKKQDTFIYSNSGYNVLLYFLRIYL